MKGKNHISSLNSTMTELMVPNEMILINEFQKSDTSDFTIELATFFAFAAATVGYIYLHTFFWNSDKQTDDIPSKRSYQRRNHIIEICLSDIESIKNSISNGVDSIELCIDKENGGLTPSLGLIEEAARLCKESNVELHVLIRPRAGLFTYSKEEYDIILRDISLVEQTSATGMIIYLFFNSLETTDDTFLGVVVGLLMSDGSIDIERMKIIRKVAKDMKLTFHRAFDCCTQSIETALDIILSIPCDRLLTSGKQAKVKDGLINIETIIEYCSQSNLEVILGSGIDIELAHELFSFHRNVYGIHIGSAVYSRLNDNYSSQENSAASSMQQRMCVSPEKVMNFINFVSRARESSHLQSTTSSMIIIQKSISQDDFTPSINQENNKLVNNITYDTSKEEIDPLQLPSMNSDICNPKDDETSSTDPIQIQSKVGVSSNLNSPLHAFSSSEFSPVSAYSSQYLSGSYHNIDSFDLEQ